MCSIDPLLSSVFLGVLHACAKIRKIVMYHVMLHLAQQDEAIPHHVGNHKLI
jgi:hypothetical protein